MTPRTVYLAATATVIFAALTVRLWDPAPVARLRLQVFDAYEWVKPRPARKDLPVRIVDIDEESLERLGQWPWPRTLIAELVAALDRRGAAAIGFEMLFSKPDRLSPEQIAEHLPPDAELRKLLQKVEGLPSHDRQLAAAIAKAPVVLGFIAKTGTTGGVPDVKTGLTQTAGKPNAFAGAFPTATVSLLELQKAARGAGALNWLPERDHVVRRMPLAVRVGGALYPALAVETLRVALGTNAIGIGAASASARDAPGDDIGAGHLRIGDYAIPASADGAMWMWFAPTDRQRYFPAWRVLEGGLERADAEGVIFLVGSSAASPNLRTTPLETAVPDIELHAQAIEQILQQRFLQRPAYATAAELSFILVLGSLVAWLIARVGVIGGAVLAVVAISAIVAGAWFTFDRLGWLTDPVYPAASLAMLFLTGASIVSLRTERERNKVREIFGHSIAPALLERLIADPSRIESGGETRDVTALFSDVHGFTDISESLDPEELTRFVNALFTPLGDIIMEAGGTIDKYMGDSVMAFWNAPLDDPDQARNACRTALRMVECLSSLNAEWQAESAAQHRTFKTVRIGIGISTGQCCAGNMGSERRFVYSIIGNAVKIATRLEGQTRTYGVDIIVGESTVEQAPELAFLELDLLKVKGHDAPVRTFALLGDEQVAELGNFQSLMPLHLEMLHYFRAGHWTAAEHAVRECEKAQGFGLEPLYEMYLRRIRRYRHNPPSASWGGVIELAPDEPRGMA